MYLAVHKTAGFRVAVKVVPSAAGSDDLATEIEVLKKCKNSNIVS